jgi:hypothetical protein
MKPGDLRRFKDSLIALGADHVEGSTFMVLRVDEHVVKGGARYCVVDILIDGVLEEGLGYFWVEDSSEVINAAG